jgi:hypothetical protein
LLATGAWEETAILSEQKRELVREEHPWGEAARSLRPWIVPASVSLYAKYYTMTSGGGYRIAARSFGRTEMTGVQGLTHWETLSFYRWDVLISIVLVPGILLIASRYMPRAWRLPIIAALSFATTVLLYAQLRAMQEVGRYISINLMWTALVWGWHEPGAVKAYIGSLGIYLLSGIVLLLAGNWWWARRRNSEKRKMKEEGNWPRGRIVSLLCLLVIVFVPWLPRVQATPFHRSTLAGVLKAFWYEEDLDTRGYTGMNASELEARYREMTLTPVAQKDPRYWEKARGANIIFFVLETTPSRFLPADDDLRDFPNLRRLRERSFVGLQHYTTYPDTNRALFSLFSSWYPTGGMRNRGQIHPDLEVPGIMHALSSRGYHTVRYAPMSIGKTDDASYSVLGFQMSRFPGISAGVTAATELQLPDWKEGRIARDRASLGSLEEDMEKWMNGEEKFAVAFFPQISHLPWPDERDRRDSTDMVRRARALLKKQDAWLGELVELLEKHHQLDHTMIVVVGDHGIRARNEDPSLVSGMIDEYTFKVPLLIFAPQALDHTEKTPWITSHVDVTPTLLDLLGIEGQRESEQGVALWNPELPKRKTFFFGTQTFGADGFTEAGRFYMWNRMTDSVYAGGQFHFEDQDFVPKSSPVFESVERSIDKVIVLEQVWAMHFSGTGAPHP